jgi:hypothetical protein
VALIRQARAIHAGQPPAQLFGFIGTEPYPGVSPLSRLEASPAASIIVTAVGTTGEFRATTAANGLFEFARLPEATYHLRVQLPKDLFIWWASDRLKREYPVATGKMCEADFPLYPIRRPVCGEPAQITFKRPRFKSLVRGRTSITASVKSTIRSVNAANKGGHDYPVGGVTPNRRRHVAQLPTGFEGPARKLSLRLWRFVSGCRRLLHRFDPLVWAQ